MLVESDEEEAIVVTRDEEEFDPEAEADFEREYAKMMAESLESRKFDRKPLFDVPLPMRRKDREIGTSNESAVEEPAVSIAPPGTMAFSLLTKRGNRQQVRNRTKSICFGSWPDVPKTRTVELPSDSNFAVAMKSQQQAEREEQQRIKNLVLNYDLRDGEDQDGDSALKPKRSETGFENKLPAGHARPDKSGNNRSGQRARKLQLSDVDWYDRRLSKSDLQCGREIAGNSAVGDELAKRRANNRYFKNRT
jgi:regulator of nonsense transcripts 2